MPTRARLDEFIAAVVSGDHAGAIERYYTEDASMQENAAVALQEWRGDRIFRERFFYDPLEAVDLVAIC